MPRRTSGSPIGEALVWAYRIMAVAVAMCVPVVAGNWLDHRWGTSVWGPVGLVVGFTGGLAALVRATRAGAPGKERAPPPGQ